MPVPDLLVFGVAGGLTMLTSAISIGCLIARDRMASKLFIARQEAERWKFASEAEARDRNAETERANANGCRWVNEQGTSAHHKAAWKAAEQELALYRADEPARAAAAVSQHCSQIGKKGAPIGNKSPVRAAKRAAMRVEG